MIINTSSDHFLIKKSDFKDLFKIMKICLFLLFAFAFQMMATNTNAQDAIIELKSNSVTVSQLISEIEKQTDYLVVYSNREVNTSRTVNLKNKSDKVSEYLNQTFIGTDIGYDFENNYIVLSKKAQQTANILTNLVQSVQQQGKTVRGTVTDSDGEPVIGATIVVKDNPTQGTVTDVDGNFILSNLPENAVLQITYVGMKPQEVSTAGRNRINIIMESDIELLDELVVVGYGTQKKANLTGAVANIQMDDLGSRPLTNSSLALQGKVSGVYALQNSGKPGADNATINIRGVGTINNSDPLVLIDGFPGSMNDVSVNDIKSISVLKDAASAAIYGNRAANGVILITTKRGDSGKMTVTYNGYFGMQEATSLPKVMNSVEYTTLYNEAALNSGMPIKYTDEIIQKYAAGNDPMYPSINYFDVYYGRAKIQNHRVNLTGGTDNLNYAFMLGYLNHEGILVATNFEKMDFRSNLDAYFLKNKKLRLSARLSGNKRETNEPTDEWNAKWYATNAPIWPLKNTSDQWIAVIGERNYYGEIQEGSTRSAMRYTFNSQLEAEYQIFDCLSAEISYGFNVVTSNTNAFHANVLLANIDGSTRNLTSDLNETDNNDTQTLFTSLLKYQKAIGKHEFNLLAGYSEEEFKWKWNSGSRSKFINNTQRILNLGDPSTMQNNAGAYDLGLQSAFGRINYIFDGKYLFEANIREDGSSRFAKGYRWGTFPSFSTGWIISEEEFMKNLTWIDLLKIRGSWGRLGNQNINTYYAASDILTTGLNYSLGGSLNSGVATTSMSNKQTTWETSEQTNIGIDIGINRCIEITVDYFSKATNDILLQIPIPITMGNLTPPYQNVGKVKNKGIEFSGTYKKQFSNGLRFDGTLNLSHIKNKVTDLYGRSPIIFSPKAYVEGYAVNSFYGYKMDGVYQISDFTWQNNSNTSIPHNERNYALKDGVVRVSNFNPTPGDTKYKDLDGDGVVTMEKDRTVIGKQFPDLTYSLQLNFDWRQFDLGLFLQGVEGIEGYTYYEISTPFSGSANTASWWKDRWTPENPTNKMPKLSLDTGRNNIHSEFYMEDASYMRLKNIELGYTLDNTITSSIGINSLRIFGNIQNAFTITNFKGFDPEQPVGETRAQAYPQVRIFSAGVNINF